MAIDRTLEMGPFQFDVLFQQQQQKNHSSRFIRQLSNFDGFFYLQNNMDFTDTFLMHKKYDLFENIN